MTLLRLVVLALVVGFCVAAVTQRDDGQTIRVPLIPESRLLHKVDPVYPPAALQRRIQGTVRLNAIISRDGRIEQLRLMSGHPLLVAAAKRAVKQWIYRLFLVGGKPVRVITQIEVPFWLDSQGRPAQPSLSASLPALPFQARLVRAELDQAPVLDFRHIARPAVRSAEADVTGILAEHIDFFDDGACR